VNRNRIRTSLLYGAITGLSLVFMLPFLWVLSTSFKAEGEIFALPPTLMPKSFTTEHYKAVFDTMPFPIYFRNSVFVSLFFIIGVVSSSSLVAYAFACLRWPGRNALFLVILATMMLPMQVTMIPVFVLFKDLGWLNTYKPLIVPAFLGGGGFNIFLLRQFFLNVPKEILDAARIDGCSEFRIYWSIMLPLARPALATVAILAFMFSWNDFLGPLIYLSDKSKSTLALGLSMLVGQYQTEWGVMMAASILMMLPMVVVFFVFQRYFVQGFMMSGLKG
jgi:ABC-type glycerol-3-phosphate transport system permease component